MTIYESDRSPIEELFSLLPVLKEGAGPFDVVPPHRNAFEFHKDTDDCAASEIAYLTTGLDPEKSLVNRWRDFIDLAGRSPPLFAPVVAGIRRIALGLNTEVAYSEMDADTRWDITQKLGWHVRSVFSALPNDGQDEIDLIMDQTEYLELSAKQKRECATIEQSLASLKDSGRLIAGLIEHQTTFESTLTASPENRFDALVLAAELFPVGHFQDSTVRRLGRIAVIEKHSDWIKPHVQAIGSESDIKYTALFKFRVDTLKMLRSPGEVLLDGLQIMAHEPTSYAYAVPKLPRPTYQSQAHQAAP